MRRLKFLETPLGEGYFLPLAFLKKLPHDFLSSRPTTIE